MVHLMELPLEVLSTIITFLAISADGAKHLAKASAICKEFRNLATQEDILKIVNFKNMWLLGREPHYLIDGLLSRCVRAGNLSAEYKLAQAIIQGGTPFWRKILANDLEQSSIRCAPLAMSERRSISESLKTGSIADLPYYLFCSKDVPEVHASYARLHHRRLVRSFIAHAKPRVVRRVLPGLLFFLQFFVGGEKPSEEPTPDMFSVHPGEVLIGSNGAVLPRPSPSMAPVLRERVLQLFDSLFESGPGAM